MITPSATVTRATWGGLMYTFHEPLTLEDYKTHSEYLIMFEVSPECTAFELDATRTIPKDLGLELYVKDQ